MNLTEEGINTTEGGMKPIDLEVQLEDWEERAAIFEYDGNMSRFTAEREACLLLFGQENLPDEIAKLAAYKAQGES